MKASRSTTIQDIGRELGLSAMTVSRALNGHPDVKEETRQRVLKLAARRAYRPNRWARSLVTRRSQIVGIVIPDISHSFFSEITRGVQDVLERHDFDLMLCHTHGDMDREQSAIDMLLGSKVDGLIVASEFPESNPGLFQDLQQQRVPFVLLDRFFPSLDCLRVRADDRFVGQLAAQHLSELGHQHIAHIAGPDTTPSRLRCEGFLAELQRRGTAPETVSIVPSNFTVQGGYLAMRELLTRNPRATAVFAGNDPAAIGAVRAIREAGLTVPADVSIIGAGSIEGADHPCPFLTTLDWPRKQLGERAAEMLLAYISNGAAPDQHEAVYAPSLVVRQSTAPRR